MSRSVLVVFYDRFDGLPVFVAVGFHEASDWSGVPVKTLRNAANRDVIVRCQWTISTVPDC